MTTLKDVVYPGWAPNPTDVMGSNPTSLKETNNL